MQDLRVHLCTVQNSNVLFSSGFTGTAGHCLAEVNMRKWAPDQLRFFSTGPPLKGLIAVDICNFSKLFLISCVLYMSRPVGIIGTTLFFSKSFMN